MNNTIIQEKVKEIQEEVDRHLEIFDNHYPEKMGSGKEPLFKRSVVRKMIEVTGEEMITRLEVALTSLVKEVREEEDKRIDNAISFLNEQVYESVDLPFDENTYEHGINEGLYQGIRKLADLKSK